jgi:stringent starvation protein B
MARAHRSRRPYLVQAIYDWCIDNGHTPHLVVASEYPGVSVPNQFVQDGRITLNISPMAVQSLHIDQDPIWFSARFSGRPFDVTVPVGAVLAIVARENGEGIVFGEVEPADEAAVAGTPSPPDHEPTPEPPKPKGRAHLRVVK